MIDLAQKPYTAANTSGQGWSGLSNFGSNPGALTARLYLPATLRPNAPLVVALHGCTQTAASYDRGTGWSVLAEREGFALLLPEQTRANNPNLCFNWFVPGDITRLGGEAESIARMVEAALVAYDLDPARVFVTGLSAGGAMTGVMLATYPTLFAGGAIIGGLPFGCASGVPEALQRMQGRGGAMRPAVVRQASGEHAGRWPSVALWHGTGDTTVDSANLKHLVAQWLSVHGIDEGTGTLEQGTGWDRRIWRGDDGRIAVEAWRVIGMGHGVPIDPTGPDRLGRPGPYMLDVGISSTAAIGRSWGLIASERTTRPQPIVAEPPRMIPHTPTAPAGVGEVIEHALRAAGLMR